MRPLRSAWPKRAAGAVVRLRFYAGLSPEEAAEALGLSPRTVYRHWGYARAWLFRELKEESTGDRPPAPEPGPVS